MQMLSSGVLGTLAFLELWRSSMHVPSNPDLDLLVGGEESTAQSQPVLQTDLAVQGCSFLFLCIYPLKSAVKIFRLIYVVWCITISMLFYRSHL